jgi:hypothetical protein
VGALFNVLSALDERDCRPRGNRQRGWQALCPAHDDRHPSLHVAEGDDGRALLICYAGCSTEQILDALALRWQDLFEDEGCRRSSAAIPI